MKYFVLVLSVLLMISCSSEITTSQSDMPNPGLPDGYEIKRFVFSKGLGSDYVYVLYKDGLPAAGASNNYSSGKTSKNVSSVVIPAEELIVPKDQVAPVKEPTEEEKIKAEVDAYVKEGIELQLRLQKIMENKK